MFSSNRKAFLVDRLLRKSATNKEGRILISVQNYALHNYNYKRNITAQDFVVQHLPTIVVTAVMRVKTPVHMTLLHDAHFARRYTSRRTYTTAVCLHSLLTSNSTSAAPRLCEQTPQYTCAPCSTVTIDHTKLDTEDQATVKAVVPDNWKLSPYENPIVLPQIPRHVHV
jgi:hypothetical protein